MKAISLLFCAALLSLQTAAFATPPSHHHGDDRGHHVQKRGRGCMGECGAQKRGRDETGSHKHHRGDGPSGSKVHVSFEGDLAPGSSINLRVTHPDGTCEVRSNHCQPRPNHCGILNVDAAQTSPQELSHLLQNRHVYGVSFENLLWPDVQGYMDVINSSCHITHLDFSNNKYGGIGEQGGMTVARALWNNRSIRCLSLRGQSLGEHAATGIATLLRRNQVLEHLDLSINGIPWHASAQIFDALHDNSGLRSLGFAWNSLVKKGNHRSGAEALGKYLATNGSLTCLNVAFTGLYDQGAQDITQGLWGNHRLRALNVRINGTGDTQLAALRHVANLKGIELRDEQSHPLPSDEWFPNNQLF